MAQNSFETSKILYNKLFHDNQSSHIYQAHQTLLMKQREQSSRIQIRKAQDCLVDWKARKAESKHNASIFSDCIPSQASKRNYNTSDRRVQRIKTQQPVIPPRSPTSNLNMFSQLPPTHPLESHLHSTSQAHLSPEAQL